MTPGRLTPLQRRILRALAGLNPPWTLTGGGALAGVHLGHRTTRDLDLFWRTRNNLGTSTVDAQALLRAEGLESVVLRTAPTFAELRVSDGAEVCVVDLVAEPLAPLEPPHRVALDDAAIAVDSMHEILVSKLTALLSRTELRDLVDVQALVGAGLRDHRRQYDEHRCARFQRAQCVDAGQPTEADGDVQRRRTVKE